MSAVYRRFVTVIGKWPIDPTKAGTNRDFGEVLRKKFSETFNQGESSKVNEVFWNKELESLEKIAESHYKSKYPRRSQSSSSGLDYQTLKSILSNDSIAELSETE
ncbi:ubiquinol-cytochrome c reductase complex assembly factor 2-like [Artemia franciscana]|uniref:ubiquinol-cytochrome c reductase complex assembly factor 2-like n=1 Tax=Artemia franciscana TaxID=6661 RepID=UPI0032D9C0EA